MIRESVTLALPPLLAKTGMKFVWQADPEVQVICAAMGKLEIMVTTEAASTTRASFMTIPFVRLLQTAKKSRRAYGRTNVKT